MLCSSCAEISFQLLLPYSILAPGQVYRPFGGYPVNSEDGHEIISLANQNPQIGSQQPNNNNSQNFVEHLHESAKEAPKHGWIRQGSKVAKQADGSEKLVDPKYWTTWYDTKTLALGPLQAFHQQPQDCDLCRLIQRILLRNEFKIKSSGVRGDVTLQCCLELDRYGSIKGSIKAREGPQPWEFKEYTWSWQLSRFSIKVFYDTPNRLAASSGAGTTVTQAVVSNAIQAAVKTNIAARTAIPRTPTTFLGRITGSICDFALIKKWLGECDQLHSSSCKPHLTNAAHERLRLIDVNKLCLTEMPAAEAMKEKYVTLSYVWGRNAQKMVLGRNNLNRLITPGALSNVSQTIKDAIDLVRQVGLKYLWVDALCIVQDDPEDVGRQIPLMASVYSSSTITIIAGHGDDANAGLPGVTTSRVLQDVVDVGDFVLSSVSTEGRSHPLQETIWITRAWTLQEQLLSHRTLTFSATSVSWICAERKWFEEMDFEDSHCSFERPSQSTFERQHWPDYDEKQSMLMSPENYRSLVLAYSERILTYDTDVVNAFSGILGALRVPFFWGLPEETIETSLLWGEHDIDKPGISRRANQVPSWSWMAWKGPIWLHVPDNRGNSESMTSVVCYRANDRGDGLRLVDTMRRSSKDLASRALASLAPGGLYICHKGDLPRKLTLRDTHIVFWTFHVRLGVCDYIHPHTGEAFPNTRPMSLNLTSSTRLLKRSRYEKWRQIGSLDTYDPASKIPHASVQDFIVISEDVENKYKRVMMVTWTGAVAQRKLLGRIVVDETEWAMAKPARRLIILA